MLRLDGKGYHPKVRLYVPHGKHGRIIRKVRHAAPAAWELAMMRLGMRFVVLRCDSLGLVGLATNEVASLESSYLEAVGVDTGAWYIDTTGCGTLQANQANPPPPKGFVRKALNWVKGFIINFGKVLSLAGLMALANACGKDPEPEPVVPTKEIVIDWNWDDNSIPGWAPPKDTIKYYTNQTDVKFVTINLIGREGVGFPVNCTGYYPRAFHTARDTLQNRIDIAPDKIGLSGTILVNSANGATMTNHEPGQDSGMAYYDSVWFTINGCIVRRPVYTK